LALDAVVRSDAHETLAGDEEEKHALGVLLFDDCGPPDGWDDAQFNFVTEDVEAALNQASEQAGHGVVGVAGASVDSPPPGSSGHLKGSDRQCQFRRSRGRNRRASL
jgi:hypothetical protein